MFKKILKNLNKKKLKDKRFEFLFDETPKNGHSPKNLANIKLFIKTMLIKIVIKLELALVIFLTLLIIIK